MGKFRVVSSFLRVLMTVSAVVSRALEARIGDLATPLLPSF